MRINNDVPSSSLQGLQQKTTTPVDGTATTAVATSCNAASDGDRVRLGQQSRLFSAGMTAGEGARTARVNELRQIYSQPSYSVDAQSVSAAIIDSRFD